MLILLLLLRWLHYCHYFHYAISFHYYFIDYIGHYWLRHITLRHYSLRHYYAITPHIFIILLLLLIYTLLHYYYYYWLAVSLLLIAITLIDYWLCHISHWWRHYAIITPLAIGQITAITPLQIAIIAITPLLITIAYAITPLHYSHTLMPAFDIRQYATPAAASH